MYPIIRLSNLDGVNLIDICRYSDREYDERQQMIINKRSIVILFKDDRPRNILNVHVYMYLPNTKYNQENKYNRI